VDGAELLVIATEWDEFASVDLALVKEKMATPIVFDGRNLFDPDTMAKLGFQYYSIGRRAVIPG
jgi:UDPglucose 6-dehydrogenase